MGRDETEGRSGSIVDSSERRHQLKVGATLVGQMERGVPNLGVGIPELTLTMYAHAGVEREQRVSYRTGSETHACGVQMEQAPPQKGVLLHFSL